MPPTHKTATAAGSRLAEERALPPGEEVGGATISQDANEATCGTASSADVRADDECLEDIQNRLF